MNHTKPRRREEKEAEGERKKPESPKFHPWPLEPRMTSIVFDIVAVLPTLP
jgi:hypothetical protein